MQNSQMAIPLSDAFHVRSQKVELRRQAIISCNLLSVICNLVYPRQGSNLYLLLRRESFYPVELQERKKKSLYRAVVWL